MSTGFGDGQTVGAMAGSFDSFVARDGERLRRALVATYGVEVGCDVWAEALAWAWEHWERVEGMDQPVGYLFRVGQSASRRHRRWARPLALAPERSIPDAGDSGAELAEALARLTPRQRTVAVLVHGYGWSYGEVAEATAVSVASVRNDLHRAMKRLRRELG